MGIQIYKLVGIARAFDQGQAYGRAVCGIAVFAIVNKGNSLSVVRHDTVFMSADLEPSLIPRGILVGGTGNVAELNIVNGGIRVHSAVESGLEQEIFFFPIHGGGKFQSVVVIRKGNILGDHRIHKLTHYAYTSAVSLGDFFYFGNVVNKPLLFLVVILYVPAIVIKRNILADIEIISFSVYIFGTVGIDNRDYVIIFIEGDGIFIRYYAVFFNLYAAMRF